MQLPVLCWEPFLVILGIILEYVPLYLRAAQSFLINVCKSFLYYSNDYCTKIFFNSISPSVGGLYEAFLVYFEDNFIYFVTNVCFLMAFGTYILDNTLIVLRLKKQNVVAAFRWELFWVFREAIFGVFLHFLRTVQYFFRDVLQFYTTRRCTKFFQLCYITAICI